MFRVFLQLIALASMRSLMTNSEPIPAAQVCSSGSSAFVDPCRTIRARLVAGGDNILIRIWPVGTTRILGFTNAERCTPPPELDSPMRAGKYVYADVVVRPLTKSQSGSMQFVCIAAVTNLTARDQPW
jgi:hypothetical protein